MFGLEGSQHQQLVTYLNEESEGNAFFLGQLLRGLEKQRILHVTDTVWQLDSARLASERPAIPDGVRAMVLERISRLPDFARPLLDLAAVMGRRFDLHLLAMALNQHSHEVGEWIEILLTRDLIREIGPAQSHQQEDPADGYEELLLLPSHSSQNVRYEFTQKLVQRVIYTSLSYGHRQRLLERIIAASDRLHQNAALIALSRKHLDKIKHTPAHHKP
jgi:predicted ATPase